MLEGKTYVVLMNHSIGRLEDIVRVESHDSLAAEAVELARALRKAVWDFDLVAISVNILVREQLNPFDNSLEHDVEKRRDECCSNRYKGQRCGGIRLKRSVSERVLGS